MNERDGWNNLKEEYFIQFILSNQQMIVSVTNYRFPNKVDNQIRPRCVSTLTSIIFWDMVLNTAFSSSI